MPHAKCCSTLHGDRPKSFQVRKVNRMDNSFSRAASQASAFQMLKAVQCHAGKIYHALVQIGRLSVRCRTPNESRNGVDEPTELSFAAAQDLFRLSAVIDIDIYAVPMNDTAVAVAQRLCACIDPTVRTVGTTKPPHFKRFSCTNGVKPTSLQLSQFTGMDNRLPLKGSPASGFWKVRRVQNHAGIIGHELVQIA